MAYLSIIVPAYKVQAYIRPCMDSILGQSFKDFELIAVDDASPDHSGEILDEYAKADSRITVIHLEQNVGLGEARNIALDRATGEYVLFVDSDDWLAAGALWAIAERLRQNEPDLLFFDHVRSRGWGKGQRSGYADEPEQALFALRDQPQLMNRMSTAWNKSYRRAYLLELGLRFPPGYYEDWLVHYPAIMATERISILNRVCYFYRQREGGITRSFSRKHFDSFDQWERLFELMDRLKPRMEEFRSEMFRRAIYHYLVILRRSDRLRHQDRKEYFTRATEHYRRYVPPSFSHPPGRWGLRYGLIARGRFRTFELIHAFSVALNPLRAFMHATKKRARIWRRRLGRLFRLVQYWFYRRLPVDENRAAFAAYWYRAPACNPLAIYLKMRELLPNVQGVWIVESAEAARVPKDIPFVVEGSREYYRLLARARYLVNNVNFPNFMRKRKGSIHLQTQHGTPLKTMGIDLHNFPVALKEMDLGLLVERADRWDYLVSSNQHSSEIWERVYPAAYEMLESGYPRNDRFTTADAAEVRRVREELGIGQGITAILYAPTHRDYRDVYEPQLDLEHVARSLPPDQVLLVRTHYFYEDRDDLLALQRAGLVIDVSEHPSIEDLCLAADVLLTDYSSIMFDYANLARPIVLYVDDYDTYRRVRGVYFDIRATPPGVLATTEAELIDVLASRRFDAPEPQARLAEFRKRFCAWDDGGAAERVVRKVFMGEKVASPTPLEARAPAPAPRDLVERTKTSAG